MNEYSYPKNLDLSIMGRKFKFKEVRKDSGLYNYLNGMSFPNDNVVINHHIRDILDDNHIDYYHAPASIYDPDQLWSAFFAFCQRSEYHEDEFVAKAIGQAFSLFAKPKHESPLEMLETEDELKSALHLDTSAGIYMGSKEKNWDLGFKNFLKYIKNERKADPCIPVRRTQRGDPVDFGDWDNYRGKSRLAFAFPITQLMLESMVAYPIIERYKTRISPIPWAWKTRFLGTKLIWAARGMRSSVGLDFSRFDSTIPTQLIRVAFSILETWVPEFPFWKKVSDYFINTPMVMMDGYLYTGKHHGIPSGSYFTQLVGSIVNWIVVRSAQLKFLGVNSPHPLSTFVLGDDSAFFTNQDINLLDWEDYFKMTFGMRLNTKKTIYTSDSSRIFFLGADWKNGVPYRETRDIWTSLVYPESMPKLDQDNLQEDISNILKCASATGAGLVLKLTRYFGGIFVLCNGDIKYRPTTGLQKYNDRYNAKRSWPRLYQSELLLA